MPKKLKIYNPDGSFNLNVFLSSPDYYLKNKDVSRMEIFFLEQILSLRDIYLKLKLDKKYGEFGREFPGTYSEAAWDKQFNGLNSDLLESAARIVITYENILGVLSSCEPGMKTHYRESFYSAALTGIGWLSREAGIDFGEIKKLAISETKRHAALARVAKDPKEAAMQEIEKMHEDLKPHQKTRGYLAPFARAMQSKYPILESTAAIERRIRKLRSKNLL